MIGPSFEAHAAHKHVHTNLAATCATQQAPHHSRPPHNSMLDAGCHESELRGKAINYIYYGTPNHPAYRGEGRGGAKDDVRSSRGEEMRSLRAYRRTA